MLGASVGRNVRVYEARFFNLASGFGNLTLEDDVHVGPGCMLDLSDRVVLGKGAVLSPRVLVLTHDDPGSHHHAPLAALYPPVTAPVEVGEACWIGANSVLLRGTTIGPMTVIGAGSVVTQAIAARSVAVGTPARVIRRLDEHDDGDAERQHR